MFKYFSAHRLKFSVILLMGFSLMLPVTSVFADGTQIDLPINFDEAGVNYGLSDFGDASTVLVSNPDGTDMVAQTTKAVGAATWAGTTMSETVDDVNLGFASVIPITASASTMTVWVYAPVANTPVLMKIEDSTDVTKSVETLAFTTQANTWEALVFDFSNERTATAAMNVDYTYDKASIFFNFGSEGAGGVYYWDDVSFGGVAGPPVEPPVVEPAQERTFAGTWQVERAAGALGVGPARGDISWWAIDEAGVTTRSCFFDDDYVFDGSGTFDNAQGDDTWLEAWQGVAGEECGAPVAPHDGASDYTWTYTEDTEDTGTLLIDGLGGYLGVPKAVNAGELPNVEVPSNVTYLVTWENDNTVILDIEAGADVWWRARIVKTVQPEPEPAPEERTFAGTWQVEPAAGALGVGPARGDISWWAIDEAGVTTRSCFFDDDYVFDGSGTFDNAQGDDTWLEAWQGVAGEECGAPVAPHDGASDYTWTYTEDTEDTGTLLIDGLGGYLGVPKAVNAGELPNVEVPSNVTYLVTWENDNTVILDIEAGADVWWRARMVKAVQPEPEPSDGTQIDLPINFDEAGVNYGLSDFGDASTVLVTNPDGTDMVAQTTKAVGAATWAGTTMSETVNDVNLGFASVIPITASASTMTVWVYAPVANTPVLMKIEDSTDVTKSVETLAFTTQANTWEALVFDFSNERTATAAMNPDYTYDKASIFFNFGSEGAGGVYYWDDVSFGGVAGPPVEPPVVDAEPLTLFADGANAGWPLWNCCGEIAPTVTMDDTAHGNVVEFSVPGNGETVQGFDSRGVGTPYQAASDGTFSFDLRVVKAPADGTPWILKMEGGGTDTGDVNLNTSNEMIEPVTGKWQTYTFDMAALAALGLDISAIDVIMVFPFWGQGTGAVYRIDNVQFSVGEVEPAPEERTFAGTWQVEPAAGALGVGPARGDISWWAIDEAGVTTRSCFFDDDYVFDGSGTFDNAQGDDTWLEAWQGVAAEECGAPVAPHDGASDYTWTYTEDTEDTGTLLIDGLGGYLGVPKAVNAGELPNVEVPSNVTYLVTWENDNTVILDIEAGADVWWRARMVKTVQPEPEPEPKTKLTIMEFDDVNGDGVPDWVGYEMTAEQIKVSLLSGDDFVSLVDYRLNHSFVSAELHKLGDRDGDGVSELGVFGFDATLNRYQLVVHDGGTGQKITIWNWPNTLTDPSFEVLADLSGDGIQEYAINGIHTVNGTRQLVVKDGDTKATYQIFKWPNLWDNTKVVTMSDVTSDGVPEVALYGRHTRLDKGQLFVYDGADSKTKVDVYNWNKLWSDTQLIEMDDVDGEGTTDWGQFGQRKDDGRYQWVVKKGHDKRGVIRVFSWPADLENVTPMLVADRTGDGVRDVAIVGTSKVNGKLFLRINDGKLANTRIANISWPDRWENQIVQELGDLNGDGFNEYAMLGKLKTAPKIQLVIKDGQTLTEYARYTIVAEAVDLSMSSYDVNDDGMADVILSGVDEETGIRHFEVLDGTNLEVLFEREY